MLRTLSDPFCRRGSSRILQASITNPQIVPGFIRDYNNYKTSGEMAKLKPPSPATLFYNEPKWPKVLDMTPDAKERRERQKFYDEIQSYPTANHKLYMINTERGRRSVFYNPPQPGYNALESYQYATRTAYKSEPETEELPEVSSDILSAVEEIIVAQSSAFDSRSKMNDILEPAPIPITSTNFPGSFEGYSFEPSAEVFHERTRAQHVMIAIINALRCLLALSDNFTLEQARLEAFWEHHRYRTNKKDIDHFSPMLQYAGQADLLISTPIPLKPLVAADSEEVYSLDFPQYDYYPEVQGWQEKERHLVSTVGYWPECRNFPLVIADDMNKVLTTTGDPSLSTESFQSSERRNRLLAAHGLLSNFACAVATAYTHGFTLYHEITYPIVSQCIISDGQQWHFSRLQLNTLAFGADFNQDRQNLAWSSNEMKLYDTVEDGKVKGLNQNVVAKIIATLTATREPIENPSPYVDLDAEKEFLDRGTRCWRHMASRRFNLGEYLEKEIPMWAKIYKMHPDALPSPHLKWERQKYLHMRQYNKKILDMEMKVLSDARKQKRRERLLYGLHLKSA
ncbi:uncharacterized protein LOC111270159 [Varroa jacobsoni]|uniref:uncharacterized protein LOC111270159 n=1 Tax=Varroa jacobsoni TaxID=62625 RepID=UPI000BF92C8B|nr:uncharacterized protein LOC111270159 [Varroa jacobsoni]